ncbi:hypothetical protein WK11_10975 [Burkholderia ubonensis]|nr:hypothetical protein WK11_10975 [Burkholderia ubonensis]KVT81506.1 hypothetical protein WK59_19465 [Burkholderia ubonensis]
MSDLSASSSKRRSHPGHSPPMTAIDFKQKHKNSAARLFAFRSQLRTAIRKRSDTQWNLYSAYGTQGASQISASPYRVFVPKSKAYILE